MRERYCAFGGVFVFLVLVGQCAVQVLCSVEIRLYFMVCRCHLGCSVSCYYLINQTSCFVHLVHHHIVVSVLPLVTCVKLCLVLFVWCIGIHARHIKLHNDDILTNKPSTEVYIRIVLSVLN